MAQTIKRKIHYDEMEIEHGGDLERETAEMRRFGIRVLNSQMLPGYDGWDGAIIEAEASEATWKRYDSRD